MSSTTRLPFDRAATGGSRTVWLIRHARTAANDSHIISGWGPWPLTGRLDIETARAWWEPRRVDRVVASPLQRCTDTARLLFGRVDDIDAAYVEQAVPGLEGMDVGRAHRYAPELCHADGWARHDADRDPRSEHLDTVTSRVISGLRNTAAEVEAGANVAVVTHGAVLAAVARAGGADVSTLGNLAVVEMDVDPAAGWHLTAIHSPLTDASRSGR